MTMNDGQGWIGPDSLSNEAYHAMDGLSSSNLKDLLKSPRHYQHRLKKGNQQTDARRIGTLTHTATLEPEVFKRTVRESPKFDKRTKAGKEAFHAFHASLPAGTQLLAPKDFDMVSAMAESVRSQADLTGIEAEVSGFCRLRDYGNVTAKIRPDAMLGTTIMDLKTCKDCSERAVFYSIRDWKYHVSAAWYMMIANLLDREIDKFQWIFVEKTAPYGVRVYNAGINMLRQGQEECITALKRYVWSASQDDWECYDPQPIDIDFREDD